MDQNLINEELGNDEEELLLVLALLMGNLDDDEDGEGREDVVHVDVEGYRLMSNASFKANFRMDRIVFERLVVIVGNHMRETGRLQRQRTRVDLILMMALWPMFNQDTFRSTGLHFGKKRYVIHYHYRYIIEILCELADRFIKWPDEVERAQIQAYYEDVWGYIGAVGCIDGVLIQITKPLENPQNYVDRHHQYSILVQAVCDHQLLYRDVYVGNPGAIGDVRNFDNSPLSRNLLTNPDMLSEGQHLLGDGAYILTDKLLIPYADDGYADDWMKTHNTLLSACRVRIENSFAALRAKHRRLKKLPMRNPFLVRYHIMACFVLHNFILLEGNDCEGLIPAVPPPIPEDGYVQLRTEARERGAVKREYIANILHPHV
ncbi:uncharacterized protein LOC117644302 [Thrips palmi]|uniref:Uncharacterized protein LOC117644302 n=1 Tax=Thrips palmi TaxID=161013 RepID=A0A6P8YZ37_THRPL|nr:uncharacterized protein LOC117644302 [Thrips palmi]